MPSGMECVVPWRETIRGEVLFAVRHEMALRLDDVVRRRTSLGALGHPGHDALETCARIMAPELGWSDAVVAREVQHADGRFPVPLRQPARAAHGSGDRVAVTADV
jgi:glycerol-3-phosphate dehydrogenase